MTDRFNRGATVTPDIGYDPSTGEEVINYDNASIAWAGARDRTLMEFDRHQDQLLEINEFNGELEHQYEHNHSEDFLSGAELPDQDVEQLKGIVGGADAYHEMTAWAAQNLPADFIQQFDAVMASNDYPAIEDTIQGLYQYYLQNATDEVEYDAYEEQDESQVQADYEYNNSVFEHFSAEGYQDMVSWAAENLSPKDQATYDRAMDSPDFDYKGRMIGWLADIYQNSR